MRWVSSDGNDIYHRSDQEYRMGIEHTKLAWRVPSAGGYDWKIIIVLFVLVS